MSEPTRPSVIRVSLTMPNGTVQTFDCDGPGDVVLEAYRLFLNAPAGGGRMPVERGAASAAVVSVAIPEPPSEREERRALAEQLVVTLVHRGVLSRARVVDKMRRSGWLEHEVRDAVTRLEQRGVLRVGMARGPGGAPLELVQVSEALAS